MKKRFCILLAMMMVICLLPMSTTAASAVWDGTIATAYAGGTGTQAAPYQIANGEQLAYFAQQVNAGTSYADQYFVLTDNIVLNDTTDWETWSGTVSPTNTWTPIGKNPNRFAGTFDGGNHTVSGIYINAGTYAGLFSETIGNVTIKNLGVIDSYIQGQGYAGAIVGFAYGSLLNCYNTGTVMGTGDVGGIAGYSDAEISYCFNLGTVESHDHYTYDIGGVVGISYGKVLYCYNGGSVIGEANYGPAVGGVVGCNESAGLQNCYNTGAVTGGNGIAGVNYNWNDNVLSHCYNVGTLDSGYASICSTYSGYETYCYYLDTTATIGFTGQADAAGVCEALTDAQMQVQSNFTGFDFTNVWTMAGDATYLYPELQNMPTLPDPDPGVDIWDGTAATGFDSGSGTDLDPYIIMTPEQLAYFRDQVNGGRNFSGEYVKVGADLHMNDTTSWQTWSGTVAPTNTWAPIGTGYGTCFSGSFDGGSHIISGIYVNRTEDYNGLFGSTSDASVHDLGLVDSYISGGHMTGGIIGVQYGNVYGNIARCYNAATVISTTGSYTGGIIGDGYGTVTDCYNIGSVTDNSDLCSLGGIAGSTMGLTMSNCYNAGQVNSSSSSAYIASVEGSANSTMTNCYYLSTGPADEKATPLTDAQMRVQSNFTGFDFTNVWTMAGDPNYLYPELRDMPAPDMPIPAPEPQPITLTVATLGGAARFDKTAIRFGASISFADMAALSVGDTVDYGFSINGLSGDALTSANWTKRSAASTTVNFAGFTWTAEMEAATTTEALAAVIRATGIKVYSYDATTITFAIILNNLPMAAQDSLWVFEPYVTINATDTSLGTAKYNSINRILEDIASGTYVA